MEHLTNTSTGRVHASIDRIIDQVPVAISILLGPDFVISSANNKQLELWHKRPEETIGQPLFKVLPEVKSQEFKALLTDVYRSGKPYTGIHIPAQFLRNGKIETGFFDFTYKPLYNKAGVVEGILVLSQEVTDKMLALPNAKSTHTAETLPPNQKVIGTNDAVFVTEGQPVDGWHGAQIFHVNESFARLTGYATEDVIGQSPRFLYGPKPERKQLARIDAALRERQPVGVKLTTYRKDSSAFETEWKIWPLAFENGLHSYWIIVLSLNAAQNNPKELFFDSETSNRTILESSPDCLKVLDAGGNLLYMNENGRCLMEIDDFCDFENKPWWELWPEENCEKIKLSVQLAFEGQANSFQAFCPTAKETPKWWDVRVSPLKNEHGSIERLLAVSRDITSFKEGEIALVNRNRQLDLVSRTAHRLIMQSNSEAALLQAVFEDVCQALGLELFFNYQVDHQSGTLNLQTSGGLTSEEKELFSGMRFGEHLCGQVAAQKKLIVVENVRIAAYPGSDAVRKAGMNAYAGFPLLANNDLIGTVSFATRKRTHFVAGEIQTIQSVCDQLSLTIERQRLNRQLQESDLRFRTIFNQQFQYSGLLSPDGKIIDISESAIRQSGVLKEELYGLKFVEAPWFKNMPEAQVQWLEQFDEALNATVSSRREAPYRVPDGTVRFALNTASAIRNSEGQVQYLLVEGIDITERKQAEVALKGSEHQFRHIFQSSPVSKWIEDYTETRKQVMALSAAGVEDFDAFFASNPEMLHTLIKSIVIKDVNEASIHLYEGAKEELLQGLQDFFVTDTLPAMVEQVKLIAAGGGRYEAETVIKAKTGSIKSVLVRIDFPLGDDYSSIVVALVDVTERRDLERKLKLQYEELESIYRNAPIGLAMISQDFRFVRINQRLAQINGVAAADHVGHKLDEIIPDLADQAKAIFNRVISTGQPVLNVEIKGETAAQPGVKRIWNESWHPVTNESGEIYAISVVVEEITERKQAEEDLRHSEEQMRLVLEASKTGVWVVDLVAMHIYWSPQHYTIFGVSSFDGQMKSFENFIHPDDHARVLAGFYAAIEHGDQYQSEFRIIRPSGEIRWVGNYGHCVYSPDRKPVRFLGTAQDITERKEAEQALLESETRFRTLAEAMPQMVWTANAEGVVLFASKCWKEYSGLDNLAEAWEYMVHPDDLPLIMESWSTSFTMQQPYKQQLRLRNKQGEYRWHYSIAEPLKDSDGVMLKWVGAMTDIHAQKTISEKLEMLVAERTRELQRSNDDLEQFAHVASHDLKEPVRKVLTFVNLLETEYANYLPEGAKVCISKINAAAKRSYQMIEGVLRYSILSSPLAHNEKVDLNTILQEIAVDLEVLATEKGAKLTVDQLPEIEGYRHLLHQLFYNIVGNALKFTKSDVPPHVIVQNREIAANDLQRLGLPDHTNYVCISIKDNGIGFDPLYAQRIFHTFARLHTKDKYEGAGLGLALCKKIAERHGGTIEADGKESEGAVFHVYLPCSIT